MITHCALGIPCFIWAVALLVAQALTSFVALGLILMGAYLVLRTVWRIIS